MTSLSPLAEGAKRCRQQLATARAQSSIHLAVAGPQGTRRAYTLCGRTNLRTTTITPNVTCTECNHYIQESENADREVPF